MNDWWNLTLYRARSETICVSIGDIRRQFLFSFRQNKNQGSFHSQFPVQARFFLFLFCVWKWKDNNPNITKTFISIQYLEPGNKATNISSCNQQQENSPCYIEYDIIVCNNIPHVVHHSIKVHVYSERIRLLNSRWKVTLKPLHSKRCNTIHKAAEARCCVVAQCLIESAGAAKIEPWPGGSTRSRWARRWAARSG